MEEMRDGRGKSGETERGEKEEQRRRNRRGEEERRKKASGERGWREGIEFRPTLHARVQQRSFTNTQCRKHECRRNAAPFGLNLHRKGTKDSEHSSPQLPGIKPAGAQALFF